MKLTVKPKIEATDQYNIRLPLSLKQRLDTLKTQAPDHGADFAGTLVGVLEEFATALEARFAAAEKNRRTSPNKSVGQPTPPSDPATHPNGADRDRA